MCTKCIRVSSTATARDVIAALAEKFRPDMRMLSTPRFAVYEIHESGGEHCRTYEYARERFICYATVTLS